MMLPVLQIKKTSLTLGVGRPVCCGGTRHYNNNIEVKPIKITISKMINISTVSKKEALMDTAVTARDLEKSRDCCR